VELPQLAVVCRIAFEDSAVDLVEEEAE
jgi:hypothetical protein